MLHIDITLEDMRMIADWRQDGNWDVTLHDTVKGDRRDLVWTPDEIGAVTVLMIAGDECKLAEAAYEIAEQAVKGLPQELRPIP